jgi:hypothetical protein
MDREEKMLEQIRRGKSTRLEFKARKEKASLSNRVNMLSYTEDEVKTKQEMMEDAVKVYHKMLPGLLQKLSRIPDHRQVERIKHKHTVLLLYGILMFVQQMGSRREVTRSMDRIKYENLQNMFRDYKWDENCLNRHAGEEKKQQYYVYVLESVLVMGNGVTLPLLSEFLKNENYVEGVSKQDCERNAFTRLAQRLRVYFQDEGHIAG